MFGSSSAGSADWICGPVHQRPPANSRGSVSTAHDTRRRARRPAMPPAYARLPLW